MTKIAIDSLKVRMPLSKVTLINPKLGEAVSEVSNLTGEVIREFKKDSLKVESDGISTYYGIEKQVDGHRRTYTYLVILFNSKLLKSQYLDGISIETIEAVYDALIAHRVVYFTFDDFMEGYGTDVDFKMDMVSDYFPKILVEMNKYAKPSKRKGHGVLTYNREGINQGIDFGDRKTASPSYPFLKLYNKELELRNKSNDFYEANEISVPKNLVRVEFTIKNKKHFNRYGVPENTLKSILSIDNYKLRSMLHDILKIHLEPRKPKAPIMKNLTPKELVFCNSIYFMLDGGISIGNIIDSLTDNIESKVARSRIKKKLNELYEYHIKDQKIDVVNREVNTFFDQVGWN